MLHLSEWEERKGAPRIRIGKCSGSDSYPQRWRQPRVHSHHHHLTSAVLYNDCISSVHNIPDMVVWWYCYVMVVRCTGNISVHCQWWCEEKIQRKERYCRCPWGTFDIVFIFVDVFFFIQFSKISWQNKRFWKRKYFTFMDEGGVWTPQAGG